MLLLIGRKMSVIGTTDNCLNFICFPWKCKKSIGEKIAVWAAFFFISWICYPIYGLHKLCGYLKGRGKIPTENRIYILKDPISQSLANFNNERINGQINGLYITTNETNLSATTQFFKDHPQQNDQKPTIHIGCAAWHNFDIMCARKSSYGLIVDYNPKNATFIKKTIDLINSSDSRDSFKQSMIHYLNSLKGKERKLIYHADQRGLPTDGIEIELSREESWLGSEENYLYIKKLASNDRLIAITEDIRNSEIFYRIRKFLDRNNITIDTLYLSNICNFMTTGRDRNLFTKSIKNLICNKTILINCPKIRQSSTSGTLILHQICTIGSQILSRSYNTTKIFEFASV